jgi:hypothetical protein
VFACGDVDPPFLLYIFPRTRLPVDGCLCKDILSSGSLIHIQCNSGDFDPISIYEVKYAILNNCFIFLLLDD